MILPCLYTDKSDQKGWGVFTTDKILKDTIVELSPVIVMSANEKKFVKQTILKNYIFDWEHEQCCMAMGFVPIYNHSYHSNCEYAKDYEAKTMYIKTVRDIEAGEELTTNYNGRWNDESELWFEVV